MEINYTWEVKNLHRETVDGYVFSVDWILIASSGDYSRSVSGSTKLDRGETLIAYEDLTKDLIYEWVEWYTGKEYFNNIKNIMKSEIEDFYAPKTDSGLPW